MSFGDGVQIRFAGRPSPERFASNKKLRDEPGAMYNGGNL